MKHTIEIKQGATLRLKLNWKSSSNPSLEGAVAHMHFRTNYDEQVASLAASSDTGSIVLDPVENTVSIAIPATTTAQVTDPGGVYDMTIHFPSGDVVRLLEGSWTLSRGVTRI